MTTAEIERQCKWQNVYLQFWGEEARGKLNGAKTLMYHHATVRAGAVCDLCAGFESAKLIIFIS